MVEPVMKMPHAAPRMHRVRDKAEPKPAKKKGFTLDSTVPQSLFPTSLDTIAAVVAIGLLGEVAPQRQGAAWSVVQEGHPPPLRRFGNFPDLKSLHSVREHCTPRACTEPARRAVPPFQTHSFSSYILNVFIHPGVDCPHLWR
jgi:hypothetical protein